MEFEENEKSANAERAAHDKAEADEIKAWVNTKSTFHANRAALASKIAAAEKSKDDLTAKIGAVRLFFCQR